MPNEFLFLQGGSLETTNTKLAACLAACGISLRAHNPIRKVLGDCRDQTAFFFEPISPCGNYKTAELIAAWDDKSWHLKNPEHPFAYLKVAMDNMERLRDFVRKGIPTIAVEKGSKVAFLSLDASDDLQKTVFTRLNQIR